MFVKTLHGAFDLCPMTNKTAHKPVLCNVKVSITCKLQTNHCNYERRPIKSLLVTKTLIDSYFVSMINAWIVFALYPERSCDKSSDTSAAGPRRQHRYGFLKPVTTFCSTVRSHFVRES